MLLIFVDYAEWRSEFGLNLPRTDFKDNSVKRATLSQLIIYQTWRRGPGTLFCLRFLKVVDPKPALHFTLKVDEV